MKKLFAPLVPFVLVSALALTGCSGIEAPVKDGPQASEQETPKKEAAPVIPDLSGNWVYMNPENENPNDAMRATIADSVISIDWDIQSAGINGVYWIGTFEAPTSDEVPYSWTSQRDKAATDPHLLASTDDTKVFTYDNDTISMEVTFQGQTTTVGMKRA